MGDFYGDFETIEEGKIFIDSEIKKDSLLEIQWAYVYDIQENKKVYEFD